MSQVMKALQRSELSHQQYTMPSRHMMPTMASPDEARGFRWYHALWLIVPGLATAAVMGVQSYRHQQLAIASMNAAPPPVNQVSAPFEQLDYPDFGLLTRSEVEVPAFDAQTDVPPAVEASPSAVPVKPTATVVTAAVAAPVHPEVDKQSQMALSDLDLSQLSPEMAARVESVLQAGDRDKETKSAAEASQAVQLVQHSDEFSGVLPAMNFQTHVYASNAVKRWIKVNGVEYREGDKIFANVQLVAIKPQSTIVRFGEKDVEIPALYDWRG